MKAWTLQGNYSKRSRYLESAVKVESIPAFLSCAHCEALPFRSHLPSPPAALCFEELRASPKAWLIRGAGCERCSLGKAICSAGGSPRPLLVANTTQHLQANGVTRMPTDSPCSDCLCVMRGFILAIVNTASELFQYQAIFLFVTC